MKIEYDTEADVLVLEGVRYAAHLFRALGIAPVGTWFRIENRADGVLTIFAVHGQDAKVISDLVLRP